MHTHGTFVTDTPQVFLWANIFAKGLCRIDITLCEIAPKNEKTKTESLKD